MGQLFLNYQQLQTYVLQEGCDYLQLYPWFYMPNFVRKVLLHDAQGINFSSLLTEKISEDAQESCNKF